MKRKAFTLIELLVVISIIAILMAILLPALRKVREQVKQKSCASKVRQQVLAMTMYADDFNGRLPMQSKWFWPWDIDIRTVNYMLKTGMKKETFYCPSNDNMVKNMMRFWQWDGRAEWDGRYLTGPEGASAAIGYLFIVDSENGDRAREQPIRNAEKKTGNSKKWLRTLNQKNSASSELVVDVTVSEEKSGTKHGYEFEIIPVGVDIHDSTSHLNNNEEPTGGNIGFLDRHVEWRHFNLMENRYGNNITFWW